MRRHARIALNAVSLALSLAILTVFLLSFPYPIVVILDWRGEMCRFTVSRGRATVDNAPQVAIDARADADPRGTATAQAQEQLRQTQAWFRLNVATHSSSTQATTAAAAEINRRVAQLAEARREFRRATSATPAAPRASWSLSFPQLVPLLASTTLAVPMAVAVLRGLRRSRRLRAGRCPICGYDLCAAPERCPECGSSADRCEP